MCSASRLRLMLVNIYMKFHEDILNGFEVIERTLITDTAKYKVQRGITTKLHKQELWFLHPGA